MSAPSSEGGAAAEAAPALVRFAQPRSTADPPFWMALGEAKLNSLRLSEDPCPSVGRMGIEARPGRRREGGAEDAAAAAADPAALESPRVRLGAESLPPPSGASGAAAAPYPQNETVRVPVGVACLNTVESFRRVDKNAFLDGVALPSILGACGVAVAGRSEGEMGENEGDGDGDGDDDDDDDDDGDGDDSGEDLSGLLSTVCLAHLDLKKHIYLYWFAFPALIPRKGRAVRYSPLTMAVQTSLADGWGTDSVRSLHAGYHRIRLSALARGGPDGCPPFFLAVREPSEEGEGVRCLPLTRRCYRDDLTDGDRERVAFAFLDPTIGGGGDGEGAPLPVGWTLRNLVAYLTLRLGLGGQDVSVVSYRPSVLRRIDPAGVEGWGEASYVAPAVATDDGTEAEGSLLLRITLPTARDYDWSLGEGGGTEAVAETRPLYRTMGYEPNARGRPGPRTVNLSPLLSPQHLSAQASDLNLRLMKWRAVPNLDLDRLGSLRVLLLGAGTLGCSVARTLQGWGVRDITLVDNGRVSYSNPVRQNLFELDDCVGGGKMKAAAAADALKRIAGEDNMNSKAVALTIPMPGHPFGTEKAEQVAREDTARLSELMEGCDVVFLLTDTRESRWLPTVMARAHGKMLLNAALGLDSWLVMRHGGEREGGPSEAKSAGRLGCYFCNDVVAPENSTNNRTLDQQCTVTRPGLAPIASSMAVELMVSLLHHPLGHAAPAPNRRGADTDHDVGYSPVVAGVGDGSEEVAIASPLGLMPHQIRGSIVSYSMMTPTVPAFPHCTGCNDDIVELYREQGFKFVKEVCNSLDGKYLEDVSGITEFRGEADKMMAAMEDWDNDDDEF